MGKRNGTVIHRFHRWHRFLRRAGGELLADGADCAEEESNGSNSNPSGAHCAGARRSRFKSLPICGYNRRFWVQVPSRPAPVLVLVLSPQGGTRTRSQPNSQPTHANPSLRVRVGVRVRPRDPSAPLRPCGRTSRPAPFQLDPSNLKLPLRTRGLPRRSHPGR